MRRARSSPAPFRTHAFPTPLTHVICKPPCSHGVRGGFAATRTMIGAAHARF